MHAIFKDAEIFSTYTRQQAIDDGVLIDVTEKAKEVGFSIHTVVTAAVWNECVAWFDDDTRRQLYQDESGRLWDVLYMAIVSAKSRPNASESLYKLYCVPRDGRSKHPRLQQLMLHVGPGDNAEPVITIMLPNED